MSSFSLRWQKVGLQKNWVFQNFTLCKSSGLNEIDIPDRLVIFFLQILESPSKALIPCNQLGKYFYLIPSTGSTQNTLKYFLLDLLYREKKELDRKRAFVKFFLNDNGRNIWCVERWGASHIMCHMQNVQRRIQYRASKTSIVLTVSDIFVAFSLPRYLSFWSWFTKRFMESHNYLKKGTGKVFFCHVYKSFLMLGWELCSGCLI